MMTSATNYYVSNSGNDTANGLTEGTAWQSLTKVNGFTFVAGDNIYFKRGNTWFGQLTPKSGTSGNHTFWGAYGTGAKPILHQSILLTSGDWTDEGSGLWSYTTVTEIGNVLFNSNASAGIRKWSTGTLTTQGDYYYDFTLDKLYLKSSSIPSTYYSNVRVLLANRVVELAGVNYATFDNLDIRYSGFDGIGNTSISTTGITITNCDISWCGGRMFTESTRLGNGVSFWRNVSNIIVTNCRIWECFDAGITWQYTDAVSGVIETNITVKNTQIWNCEYGIEYFNRSPSGESSNILIENNTIYGSGLGWGHSQRTDPTGRAIRLAGTPTNTTNFVIQNNIFFDAVDACLSSYVAETSYTVNYNCFYNTIGDIADINFTNITNWTTYKTQTGWDTNSINTNPLLANVLTLDFTLSSNSPAIDTGNPLSVADADGTRRDMGYIYFNQSVPGTTKKLMYYGKNIRYNGKYIIY